MAAGKVALSLVSVLLVVGVIIGAVLVTKKDGKHDNKGSSPPAAPAVTTSTKTATSICSLTDYKDACINSLGNVAKNESATPKDYMFAIIESTLAEFNKSHGVAHGVKVDEKNEYENSGLDDCKKCLQFALEDLQEAINMVRNSDMKTIKEHVFDLQNTFTALLAYKGTCLDEVQLPEYRSPIENGLVNATQLTSNALYILAKLDDILAGMGIKIETTTSVVPQQNTTMAAPAPAPAAAAPNRRLLEMGELGHDGYPTWLSAADRKLLAAIDKQQNKNKNKKLRGHHGPGGGHHKTPGGGAGGAGATPVAPAPGGKLLPKNIILPPNVENVPGVGLVGANPGTYVGAFKPNAVVDLNGSGQYRSIIDAINAIPANRQGRWIIYVKEGTYREWITIPSNKPDILMYGDGPTKTIVTGSKSAKTKFKTMFSATFAVEAPRFIGKGMGFQNTAGPDGHQAVAFRSKSDMSAMFDCSFEGYQDTLYYHANRQFYKNCVITGTVDFIFGQSARALIQDSDIIVRRPMDGQSNTVTSDGCDHTAAIAGLVIQGCHIMAEKDQFDNKARIPSYLGRPWSANSFTAIAQTSIEDFIHPMGYLEWEGKEKTAIYVEYQNTNTGGTQGRGCKWNNLRVNNPSDAQKTTVGVHLEAGLPWVANTGVPAYMGLKGGK